MSKPRPEPQPALQRLLDLACATRPDLAENRLRLEGLLIGHRDSGTPWRKLLVQTVLMCAHGDGLRELDDALRDPTKPHARKAPR